jgi:Uma2 family endonuclease
MSTEALAQPATRIEPRRFTADEFLQMYEAGILADSERLELLAGELLVMSPIGPLHASIVNRLNRWLVQKAGDKAIVSPQNAILLDPHSLPQPDFALLKPRDDEYAKSHAQPHEVLLLIEVSHTSYHYDLSRKLPLYAKAGIDEVWIVDLNKQQIEQFSQPAGAQYKQHAVKTRHDAIVASQLSAITFRVEHLFS